MIKLLICSGMFLFSSLINACSCITNEETAKEIYDRVDGIYYVSVVGINMFDKSPEYESSIELELDLKIIDTIKGNNLDILKAKSFGNLPLKDVNGDISISESSCDIKISFGNTYMIAIKNDESIRISMCSPQIIDRTLWFELKDIHEELLIQ